MQAALRAAQAKPASAGLTVQSKAPSPGAKPPLPAPHIQAATSCVQAKEQKDLFALVDLLVQTTNPEEESRLKETMASIVFGE